MLVMKKEKKRAGRANGQGTLEKRGNYWLARWTVNGKHFSRSTKCEDKREAEKKLAEYVRPFQSASEIEVLENLAAKVRVVEKLAADEKPRGERVRVKFLVDCYARDLNVNKMSDGTRELYETVVSSFMRSCSAEYAGDVTAEDAKKWLVEVKEKSSEARYNLCLSAMKRMFRVAMAADGTVKKNPFSEWKCLKMSKVGNRRELSDDELSRIAEWVSRNLDAEHQALFALGLYAGLRLSDCANLKWSSVDFLAMKLRVLPMKTKRTGKMAVVPMHPTLAKMLGSLPRESEHVLPRVQHEYWSGALGLVCKKAFSGAGIVVSEVGADGKRRIVTGFHSFRHTFASRCMRAGIPVNQVQVMMAHSKADMSLHYSHVQEADLSLPSFDSSMVDVKVSKEAVELASRAARCGESFSDVVLRALKIACGEEVRELIAVAAS